MGPYEDYSARAYLKAHVENLERLVADLKVLSKDQSPSEECLRNAPLLEQYTFATRDLLCLDGYVENPSIPGELQNLLTSPLCFMAEDYAWARTYGRFYRLGRPMSDDTSIN